MKKVFLFILTILLAVFICILCFSFTIKKIVISTLSQNIVKKEITSYVLEEVKDIGDLDYEVLEEVESGIGNSFEISEITEKYFDNIVESVINDKDIVVPNTKEEIKKIIDNTIMSLNDDKIEITNGKKEEIISALVTNGKINTVYENVAKTVKNNLSDTEKEFVEIYNKVSSDTFKWFVLSIIVILVLLIAIIKKSLYKWTYNLGVSLALSGMTLSLLAPLLLNNITAKLSSYSFDKVTEININELINLGYICFIGCAISTLIYILGDKVYRHVRITREY